MNEAVADPVSAELRVQSSRIRFLATPVLRAELERVLMTERKRQVYQLIDGVATVREISRASGAGLGTISGYWTEWERLGLVRPVGSQGRMQHVASLPSLGMTATMAARSAGRAGNTEGEE